MEELTLEQRQNLDKNRRCMWASLVTLAFMLIAAFVYGGSRAVPAVMIGIVEVILMVLCVLAFQKYRLEDKSRKFCLFALLVGYVFVFLPSLSTPYLYAFMYPITLIVIMFSDVKVCNVACLSAIAVNIAYFALYFALTDRAYPAQEATDLIFCFLTCFIASMVVRVMDAHSSENMDSIREAARVQEETAARILNTSREIADRLKQAESTVENLSQNVTDSAESISAISDSTKFTAEAIQTQTEMSSNITESLNQVSNESKAMLAESNDASTTVREGNDIVNRLKEQSQLVSEVNKETMSMTNNLQTTAESVKEIVSAILAISSQTNLLALNASIEAARAGEAGKGFAVVADEIRNLSENTKQSAVQIGDTIDALIRDVEGASSNMMKSVNAADVQGELISETGEKFEAISGAMESLVGRIEEISALVENSVDANCEVMDSISNLSATSEEVAASSESSLTMSEQCVVQMNQTDAILQEILELSQNLN